MKVGEEVVPHPPKSSRAGASSAHAFLHFVVRTSISIRTRLNGPKRAKEGKPLGHPRIAVQVRVPKGREMPEAEKSTGGRSGVE